MEERILTHMNPLPPSKENAMRVHVLQHAWFEDIGSIRGWLDARRAHRPPRFFEPGATLPAVGEADLLIVMGGPMSVNDTRQYPG